jgi:hypothetical protein
VQKSTGGTSGGGGGVSCVGSDGAGEPTAGANATRSISCADLASLRRPFLVVSASFEGRGSPYPVRVSLHINGLSTKGKKVLQQRW